MKSKLLQFNTLDYILRKKWVFSADNNIGYELNKMQIREKSPRIRICELYSTTTRLSNQTYLYTLAIFFNLTGNLLI